MVLFDFEALSRVLCPKTLLKTCQNIFGRHCLSGLRGVWPAGLQRFLLAAIPNKQNSAHPHYHSAAGLARQMSALGQKQT
jgi:hypothetical protein